MQIKTKTESFIEYSDLRDEVTALLTERLGRKVDIRDFAGKFDGFKVHEVPYQDFWHFWIHNIDMEVRNDVINPVYWSEMYEVHKEEPEPDNEWTLPILDAYNEILLTVFTQEQLDTGINVRYSW